MPSMFCPACNANLDAVAIDRPCPNCGHARSTSVALESVSAKGSVGEVGVLVQQALDQLAALPPESAKAVLEEAVLLSGTIAGRTTLSGSPTVTHEGKFRIAGTADLAVIGYPTIFDRTTTMDSNITEVVRRAPAVFQLVERSSDLRTFLLATGAGVASGLTVAAFVYFLQQTAPPQPTVEYHLHYHAAPGVALVQPASTEPAPNGDLCLPGDESKAK